MTFDNFVQASVTVKTLTDSFRQYDTDGDGWIQIKYEDVSLFSYIHMYIYMYVIQYYAVTQKNSLFNCCLTALLLNTQTHH